MRMKCFCTYYIFSHELPNAPTRSIHVRVPEKERRELSRTLRRHGYSTESLYILYARCGLFFPRDDDTTAEKDTTIYVMYI